VGEEWDIAELKWHCKWWLAQGRLAPVGSHLLAQEINERSRPELNKCTSNGGQSRVEWRVKAATCIGHSAQNYHGLLIAGQQHGSGRQEVVIFKHHEIKPLSNVAIQISVRQL
jgi:hypothetical protein